MQHHSCSDGVPPIGRCEGSSIVEPNGAAYRRAQSEGARLLLRLRRERCANEKAPEDIRGLVAYWDIPGARLDCSIAGENAVTQAQRFT